MTDACADGRCPHCKYPVPQPTTMELAMQKWESEGRTREEIWAVRNFMTGAGANGIKQVEAESKKDALGVVHDEILDTAEFDFEAEKHTTVKWEDVERIIKKYL